MTDYSADEREFLRRKALFEELVETAAWKELKKIGEAQITSQTLQVMVAPPDTGEGVLYAMKDNYRKGAVFGIDLILKTPYATIATAKDIIREKEPHDGRQRYDDSNDGDGEPTLFGPDTIVTDLAGK